MNSGVYKITNIVNNNIYIGSATNFNNRWRTHKLSLQNNKHHSLYLQNAWNKYGKESFVFEIIEQVKDKTKLIEREQHYLDTIKTEYNICKVAGSCLGRITSPETKEKIREKRKLQIITEEMKEKLSIKFSGSGNPNFGKCHSEETKNKMRVRALGRKFSKETLELFSATRKGDKNPNNKIKQSQYLEIINKYKAGYTQVRLGEEYGVSRRTIGSILKKERNKNEK